MEEYKTIRGFKYGPEEEPSSLIFKFSASIRIGGLNLPFSEYNDLFRVLPSRLHRKGDSNGTSVFDDDMWLYESTQKIKDTIPLEYHLMHLNEIFLPHIEYIKEMQKNRCDIKLYTSYYSNCDHGGIELPFECLRLYIELNQPFGIGIFFI